MHNFFAFYCVVIQNILMLHDTTAVNHNARAIILPQILSHDTWSHLITCISFCLQEITSAVSSSPYLEDDHTVCKKNSLSHKGSVLWTAAHFQ